MSNRRNPPCAEFLCCRCGSAAPVPVERLSLVHPLLALTDVKRRPRYVATRNRERERGMDLLAITNTWKCFPTSFAPLANCVAQSHELEAPATFIGSDGNSNSGFPPPTASASVTRVALLSCPLFRYVANVGKRRPWHRTWTTWLTRPGQPSSEYPKNNPLQYYRQFTPASPVVAEFPWISMQVDAHEKLPGPA